MKNKTEIGCVLGNDILNYICYADDLLLISPSLKGLQKLMNICYDHGKILLYSSMKPKLNVSSFN